MKATLALVVGMLLLFTSSAHAAEIFVSRSNGSNGNDGTKAQPLKNIEKALKKAVAGDVIHDEDLSEHVRRGPTGLIGPDSAPDEVRNLEQLVEQVEVEEIRKALMITEGNKTKAADALGISRFTLQRKMEKYHLT